jgi:hypothetical protein
VSDQFCGEFHTGSFPLLRERERFDSTACGKIEKSNFSVQTKFGMAFLAHNGISSIKTNQEEFTQSGEDCHPLVGI